MYPIISLTDKEQQLDNLVIILSRLSHLPAGLFSKSEKVYIGEQVEKHKKEIVRFNRIDYWIYVFVVKEEKEKPKQREACRKAGDKTGKLLNEQKAKRVAVFDTEGLTDETLAFAEGMALGCYQFLKYKNDRKDQNTLEEIEIYSKALEEVEFQDAGYKMQDTGFQRKGQADADKHPASSIQHPTSSIQLLNILTDAVFRCRDLINEPNSYLTATVFAGEVVKMIESCGVSVEILNKKKLEALKMGGILGVNQGSLEPPTFTVLEWKPKHSRNKKPFVFIGKGVVYDSGGMNLKPGDSMMNMKDDMSGAAAVASSIYAIAKAKLPVHVVGLLPATDNRPGEKALVSGDIIRMHNSMTVEVMNTDAEGRLLLADALSYAQKYHPGLVIDLATLTGSAVRAIGKFGAAAMQSKAVAEMEILKICGENVCERLVEFPLWEEYGELVKSDLADLKNIGPAEAGMITAGKFLEKFTDYPYIHLDIAGPAFLEKQDSYRGQGGTGFGVRLLFDFIAKFAKKQV
ncbi:MAG: leucyl aminopeptidase [Bacteroidales bacterium]|jgi:leucyl aminopeptidase|nr:leucyl aminopeptidase [Bacteroidales bacterium]